MINTHAVRIISMDNSGNLAFAVYGYMNRGNTKEKSVSEFIILM